ncbi:MAG: VTT domain-containing protein [Desulfuromonadales bacterium]|nr:VTT domain-containing protein [Desulfuromonadales bacterium]
MENRILQPGRNCWQLADSGRAAFLVDGEAYFSAFAAAAERARHSVLVLGWDIDSRIRLRRSGGQGELPDRLGEFLNAIVSRRRGLHIHVLDWDFLLFYAFEREPLPLVQLGWRTHRRLHFHLDDRHPVGASHHQKIVVIDDAVAFVGGLDLSQMRWDTPAHAANEPQRCDNGVLYPPFHDVQVMVDGEAAACLGQLARQRWQRATGKTLQPPPAGNDPWPPQIVPELRQVQVAIARTDPAYNGHPEVREVEWLYLDAIAAARISIYLENQFFTSGVVAAALAERLLEEEGPEILLVLPRECSGWWEESTMGALRARLLRQLVEADRFGHLRVCYPHNQELVGKSINVHSKVMVVDDRLVRVGSANLSNRSMGLDTECDLAVEADRGEVRQAIVGFRHRLLAEHLGTEPAQVAEAVAAHGSLLAAVEALAGGERSLHPLDGREESWLEQIVPEGGLIDPERPMSLEQFVDEVIARDPERMIGKRVNRRWLLLAGILLVALGLAFAWKWTPLGEWVDLAALRAWGVQVQHSPWALLWVMAAFIVGGMVIFPVTLLILATALVFPPIPGFVLGLSGCLASAAVMYGLGRQLGHQTLRRFAGPRLNRLSKQLGRRGLVAVTVIRFLPVAPYSVVNMMAGASHIRFRDFLGGTLLGMGPGVIAINLFEYSLLQAIRQPQGENFAILALVVLGVLLLTWWLRRWLASKQGSEPAAGDQ